MDRPAPRALEAAERLAWLRLIRTPQVGPITFFQLLQRFGTAAAALKALPDLARRGGRGTPMAIPPLAEAERELAAVAAAGARLVAFGEADYPPGLAAIDDPPPLLSLKGRAPLGGQRCLGIVGARNASAIAIRFTREIAAELGRQDLVIVSGLARGIDAAAHAGALGSGTIAVLGGGIDVAYPAENRKLQDRIADEGLLVAETPVGTEPQARHFPRRNRLISGISLGVLVIEAAPQSGSLITARMALEQGREVFAVPGSPLDPRARGTNDLIRQGATLVETADDVLRVLQTLRTPFAEPPGAGPLAPATGEDAALDPARALVLEKLAYAPVELDEILRQTGLSPAVLHLVLLELDLAGRLQRHPGNKVSRL